MKTLTPAPAGTTKPAAKNQGVQVLRPGNRRILGGTKFGQDGCGY